MPSQPSDPSAQRDEVREVRNVVRVAFLGTPLVEEPDEASPKLAYLNKGTLLNVLDETPTFLHVQTPDGASGFVRANAVSPG